MALGFLLGGIVSPTDTGAATSVMRSLGLPHRLLVVLKGESLVTEVSGLLVIQSATATVASGSFPLGQAMLGLAVALVFYDGEQR